MLRAATLILALFATAAAPAAELPPEVVEATDQAMVECAGFGGRAEVLPAYATRIDLNGDGVDDYLTDLAGLQCVDAWSAFCGSAGCPVTAWLSQADGGFARFDFGHLQGFEIAEASEGLPVVRAHYHGAFCGEGRADVDGCARRWTFATSTPKLPPIEGEEVAAVAAETPDAPPIPELPEGWTLREVPGGNPLALGAGVGDIAYLAGFCLEGRPFLAVRLEPPREAAAVAVGFAFSQGPVVAEARFEPTADGAHVIALEGSPLAARLAGRDSRVEVSLDGVAAGVLSLAGSTRALRGALGVCGGL